MSRRRVDPWPKTEWGALRAGDTIEYGNGHRVRIVNFLLVNGQPGIQLDDPDQFLVSDRFKALSEIETGLRAGYFKHLPAKAQASR